MIETHSNNLICTDCGKITDTTIDGIPLCQQCLENRKQEKLRKQEDTITEAASFRKWKMEEMSELFWIHLGLYQKEPNQKSADIMRCALDWAVHADHGLANSFRHALKWVGINNIYKECLQWRRSNKSK